MVLKDSKFYLVILAYLSLGIYVVSVVIATPFIHIELTKWSEKWIVKEFFYEEWTDSKNLNIGDIILEVDKVPVNELTHLEYSPYIRGAKQITYQNQDGGIVSVDVLHKDLPHQWYIQIIIPIINYILILFIAMYLFHKKKKIEVIDLLIYFILVMSLAYISSGASARLDYIGVFVNSSCLLLCVVLLIHFLKNYFNFLSIEGLFPKRIQVFYALPFIGVVFRGIGLLYPTLFSLGSLVILIVYISLVIYIFIVLLHAYIHYKLPKLKLLVIGLLVPFLPFLLLYVIPEILWDKPILEADICAIILMLIPFNIIFLQLTNRLFDISYHISRLRYYLMIGCIFMCWLLAGFYFIIDLTSIELLKIIIFLFISIIIFLYLKEKADYRWRKILFSSKGNSIHKLYQITQNLGSCFSIEQIFQVLTNEISKYLEIKKLNIISYDLETSHQIELNDSISFNRFSDFESLGIGEIIKSEQFYIALIHQDAKTKKWLIINHQYKFKLKAEELLWLELLIMYTSSFIDSTKIIEELMEELKYLKEDQQSVPLWFNKLVWLRIEQEGFKIAQELHDTFLQEHIHIARQMDLLLLKKEGIDNIQAFKYLHEQMLYSINQLRNYCEKLKPPLLSSLGLHAALECLAEKTEERADFKLLTSFDRLYLEDEQLILTVYRIAQELLNNAIKHSKAKKVEMSIEELDDGLEITYADDGIGCDLDLIWISDSLGLQGIKERVAAFDGKISMKSSLNNGLEIRINIYGRRDSVDISLNC